MSTSPTQVILDTFKRLGEPATRGELFDMLADPDIDRKVLNGRIANLERDGKIERVDGGDGPIRYQLANAEPAKGRKVKPAPPEEAAPKPASATVTLVEADSTTTSTLKLTADQARELAVITLSHPRPLSERMRKTVIDLVRIAA